MYYRCRLGLLGNSSTASGRSNSRGTFDPFDLQGQMDQMVKQIKVASLGRMREFSAGGMGDKS